MRTTCYFFLHFLLYVSSCLAQDNCTRTLDIVFVADGSNSLGPSNFRRLKNALDTVISKFAVVPGQARVGVVTYGDNVRDVIPLTDDVNSLRTTVQNLNWPDGGTATYAGLREATAMLMNNSRLVYGIPQVIVLLTDGESDRQSETFQVARDAKSRGITILTVGIGILIQVPELMTIASSPNYVYLEQSYENLSNRLLNLTKVVCETPACSNGGLDAMFVMDGSNSVRRKDFLTALSAINQTAMTFWRNYTASRIGLITYGSSVSQTISLTTDEKRFFSSISNIDFPDTGTGTDLALIAATQQLQSSPRKDVSQVIVLITDGTSDHVDRTLQAAQAAKAMGIVIFAIGVGRDVNRDELTAIGSDRKLTFTVDNFGLLEEQLKSLISTVCDGPPTTTTISTPTTTRISPVFTGCNEKVELLFVIDGSDGTGMFNFERLKLAVTSAALLFTFGPSKAKVGVVSYSNTVKGGFGPVSNGSEFVIGMASLAYPGGPRTTSEGMRQAAQYLINSNRYDAVNVLVVVTTGTSDSPFRVSTDSFFVRQTGIKTFALGVTSAVNLEELQAIANQQPSQLALSPTYDALFVQLAGLMSSVCQMARGGCSVAQGLVNSCRNPFIGR